MHGGLVALVEDPGGGRAQHGGRPRRGQLTLTTGGPDGVRRACRTRICSRDAHGLLDEGLDDLRLGHGLDDLALDEDLPLAVARGDAEVGLAGLARGR